MINKHAATGEGILNIYRMLIVTIIALVILGSSSLFYNYYIDIRSVESVIISKQVINCLAPDASLSLDFMGSFQDAMKEKLSKCNLISESRYLRIMLFFDSDPKRELSAVFGNTALNTIKSSSSGTVKSVNARYFPGCASEQYRIIIGENSNKLDGVLNVEACFPYDN